MSILILHVKIIISDVEHMAWMAAHSMEEADFLCDRLGIMVGGNLKCVGSSKEVIHMIWDPIILK